MRATIRGGWVLGLCLAAGAVPAADDPAGYDLRGPAPVKGQVYHARSVVKMTDGALVLKFDGTTVRAKQTMTVTTEEEEKVLAVDGRQVTKSQARVVKDTVKTKVQLEGEEAEEDDEPGELEGEVIISTRAADGTWKHALVDGKPTDKQKKELDKRLGPESDDDVMPDGKVKVGHAWITPAAKMKKIFGNTYTDVKGTLKQEFLRVEDARGEKCAVIRVRGPVTGKMKDDDGDLDFEMDLDVTLWRSLNSGVDVKDSFRGKVKMSGKQKVDGAEMDLTLTGELVGGGTTALK